MNAFDIIILVIWAIGLGFGLYHGFLKELVGTVGFLVAAIVAKISIPYLLPYSSNLITDATLAKVLIWIVVFVLLLLLMNWIATLMDKLLKAMNIGWINRIAGGVLGFLKYSVISYLVIWMLEAITRHIDPFEIARLMSGSKLVPVLHKLFDLCCSLI